MIEENQDFIVKSFDSLKKLSNTDDNDDDDDYDTLDAPKKADLTTIIDEVKKDKDGFVIPRDFPPKSITETSEDSKKDKVEIKKRKDTPLAAMLPSKYENLDVTQLFPNFRYDQVLRFSRLFGPGKLSSMPQIWKNVKNKRKNRVPIDNNLNGSQSTLLKEFKLNVCEPEDISAELIEEDDAIKLVRNSFIDLENLRKELSQEEDNKNGAEWRHGPASFWYDRLNVPENGQNFNYGFKLKNESGEEKSLDDINSSTNENDDIFNLVTQYPWENEIIWNADEVRQKILSKLNEKHSAAGWLPSGHNRTATAFTQQNRVSKTPKSTMPMTNFKKNDKKNLDALNLNIENAQDETWYSIFPIENEELVYGFWEDDVIWDAEAMDKIPIPQLLVLDRNDENIIFEVPIDEEQNETKANVPAKEKKEGIRKSRLLLGKAGVIAEPEINLPPSPPSTDKDPFNISNDEFYSQRTTTDAQLKSNVGSNLIQHSIPALELRQPFFPTFLSYQRLRAFHRPALKRFSHGALADALPHGVNPLVKHIKRKAKQREQERLASGGGEMFFMRTPEDLTGKDGDLILTEYSEEHPPLVMQIGMASKIKNYYKRRMGKDIGAPQYKFGETIYYLTSPFLGNLPHGQSIQAFENNLFRAPMYEHSLPESDFLVIRTRDNYYIREVEKIFTLGQELPLFEVPGPNSKKANNFMRDFLQVFIFRLFWKSTDTPKRIKMEDIKKAFPSHSESSIRKRLKQCADFKRTGMDSNWWVLKSDFRLPSEDEIRAMVSPESCCAYYSMLAAEQRLKDAGYGEKLMFAPDDAEDEDMQLKMEDEVKAAPWNTTRAFISAMKGKCLLQLTGVADPTGCGEGFSYVRIPNKPQQSKEETQKEVMPKKTVTGTDADLRRLSLNSAKQLLRKFGVPDDEIKKLSRWEVIDVVRTLSTKQVKQSGDGPEDDAMSKFARGNRFSIAEHQERYKEECQRIFELQNRVLASTEDLSTDEDESEEEEDSEIEELGKNIESMLANKKTINQISQDKEEEERRELKKLFLREDSNLGDSVANKKRKEFQKDDKTDDSLNMSSSHGRILKIYRTYTDSDNKEFVRIETVRKPAVIDTYVRIRTTKDENFIKQFASALDDQQKEERRKEKRRQQEQVRRQKRIQEKEKLANSFRLQYGLPIPSSSSSSAAANIGGNTSPFSFNKTIENACGVSETPKSPLNANPLSITISMNTNDSQSEQSTPTSIKELKNKKIRKEKESNSKVKCGACGGVGHTRSNRICPMFKEDILNEDNLVQLEDMKLVVSKSLIKHHEQQKSKAIKLKISKDLLNLKRKRKTQSSKDDCEYLQRPDYRSSQRRRTDPLVSLSDIFEEIHNEMRSMSDTEAFHLPVNSKNVPDYYTIIKQPMDLQTLRKNIRSKKYKNREDFMQDVNLIWKNSEIYNGPNHLITSYAKKMTENCFAKIVEKEEEIIKLEKIINPLLDEDQTAFSYILKTIVTDKLKTIPDSWHFHKPVNKKTFKNYYDVITEPMDLETLETNSHNHKYQTIESFLCDVEKILENSIKFNGSESNVTKKAYELFNVARNELIQYESQLLALERAILNTNRMEIEDHDEESNSVDEGEPPIKQRLIDYDNMDIDEEKSMSLSIYQQYQENETDIVADDLQITPQNSGDESDDEDDGGVGDANDQNDDEAAQSSWPNEIIRNNEEQYQRSLMELKDEENFDENYDPSEFLLQSSFAQQSNFIQKQQQMVLESQQQNIDEESTEQVDVSQDLDISDSDEEQNENERDEEDNDALWF